MAALLTSLQESRFYSEFVNGLNKATDIVTENLAQHFVNLRRRGLALEKSIEHSSATIKQPPKLDERREGL
jgi:hypothetical protein